MDTSTVIGACGTVLLWTGCTAPPAINGWSVGEPTVVAGLSAPECCLFDPASGNVFVSNIVAAEGDNPYWSDDGAGHLSLLGADGVVHQEKWLAGDAENVIHAPKGMCLLGNRLWMADNTRLVSVRYGDGTDLRVISPPGAVHLNDMASDGTHVYVSDTTTWKVLRIAEDGRTETVANIEAVNGLTIHDGTMFAVSWGLHEIYEVDLSGQREPRPFGLAEHFTTLDGIEVLKDGTFLVTDFEGGRICTVSADRKTVETLALMPTPADLGVSRSNSMIYVPSLKTDVVHVFPLIAR